jgi:hypothetical protein
MSRHRVPVAILSAILSALVLIPLQPGGARAAPRPDAFVGVVIEDPDGTRLGVAGAFCGLRDAASMATIDPSRGAVVAVPPEPARADTGLRGLQAGAGAGDLVAVVPGTERGTAAAAAVTIDGAPAARAGAGVPSGAAITGSTTAVVAGGFASDDLRDALAAGEGDGTVPERLLATLDAVWTVGTCKARPSDAFLIVTGPADAPVAPARGLPAARRRVAGALNHLGGTLAADELADRLLDSAALPHPEGPGAPEIYLSLLQPPGGFDAAELLAQAYAHSASATPSASAPTAASRLGAARGGGRDPGPTYIALGLLAIGFATAVIAIARRLRTMKDQ